MKQRQKRKKTTKSIHFFLSVHCVASFSSCRKYLIIEWSFFFFFFWVNSKKNICNILKCKYFRGDSLEKCIWSPILSDVTIINLTCQMFYPIRKCGINVTGVDTTLINTVVISNLVNVTNNMVSVRRNARFFDHFITISYQPNQINWI